MEGCGVVINGRPTHSHIIMEGCGVIVKVPSIHPHKAMEGRGDVVKMPLTHPHKAMEGRVDVVKLPLTHTHKATEGRVDVVKLPLTHTHKAMEGRVDVVKLPLTHTSFGRSFSFSCRKAAQGRTAPYSNCSGHLTSFLKTNLLSRQKPPWALWGVDRVLVFHASSGVQVPSGPNSGRAFHRHFALCRYALGKKTRQSRELLCEDTLSSIVYRSTENGKREHLPQTMKSCNV